MIGGSHRCGLKFHIGARANYIFCLRANVTFNRHMKNAVSHFGICIFLESCGWNETGSLDQLQSACTLHRVVVRCVCVKHTKINYFSCIVHESFLA